MQTAADVAGLFGHGPACDCRIMEHSAIGLSGQPASDLNMVFLAAGADDAECTATLAAVRDRGVDALLVVAEDAPEARAWADAQGLTCVGQLPLMERAAADLRPAASFSIRRVGAREASQANRIAAAAFSLDEEACNLAMAPATFDTDDIDLWLAQDDGEALGCGVFIRSGEHVGIYTMATHPDRQKRGAGRAILETAMAHYQEEGVTRFTLGATEKGYPLYTKVGFETVASPYVYVIGASTQFPGS